MTAICKVIPIHSKSVAPVLKYVKDAEKTDVGYSMEHSDSEFMRDVFDYTTNPLKTQFGIDDGHEELLVSGVNCNSDTAVYEFAESKLKYLGSTGMEEEYQPFDYVDKKTGEIKSVKKEPVQAIHLIQSFAETELDPRVVHQIGKELVERLGNEYQAVVSTHMNKEHVHNHIVINSYLSDGSRKIPCNKEKLMEIRELSDTLQREYGIEIKFSDPEHQLRESKLNGQSISYAEWRGNTSGTSWKSQMKDDIANIHSIAESKEEFIEMMNNYGYEVVRKSENSITWYNAEIGKKIRDTTLGQEYSIGQLYSDKEKLNPLPVAQDSEKSKSGQHIISVARYDWDGRRRSDLEMIIRKVIATIQRIGITVERMGNDAHHYQAKNKIQIMDEALNTLKYYGIDSKDNLKDMITQVASEMNHQKSVLSSLNISKDFYLTLKNGMDYIETVKNELGGHLPGQAKIMLPTYSESEIRQNLAKRFPMTDKQKRELYIRTKEHPELHLAYKYNEISKMDAQKIINYFNGKDILPDNLLLSTETYARKRAESNIHAIYERRNENLKSKYSDKPVPERMKTEIDSLLHKHGITCDIDKLSHYDALNIRSCFGDNPVIEPELSSTPIQDELNVAKLKSFMEAKNIEVDYDVTYLSNSDFNTLQAWVLAQGETPDIVKSKDKATLDLEFYKSIESRPLEEQLYLTELRNQMNYLVSIGIDPYNMTAYQEPIEQFFLSYEVAETIRDERAQDYKTFLKLTQSLTYAESPNFVYGPFALEKEQIQIIEKEERDAER